MISSFGRGLAVRRLETARGFLALLKLAGQLLKSRKDPDPAPRF